MQYSTYQLSFAQLESNVCEVAQTVIYRLPPGFRDEIPFTCAGHSRSASTHTKVIHTGTRKRMSGTNIGFRPSQCEWWKVWIQGVILNCFTSICRIKQSLVGWVIILFEHRLHLPYLSTLETVTVKPILRAEEILWNCCVSARWMSTVKLLITAVTRSWAVALLNCKHITMLKALFDINTLLPTLLYAWVPSSQLNLSWVNSYPCVHLYPICIFTHTLFETRWWHIPLQ